MAVIRVQREDFDAGLALTEIAAGRPGIGGIASFIGLVRCEASGRTIEAMTLEHYPGMTERALRTIAGEAERRWPLEAVLIIHRYGKLAVGDRIVLVVTASAHRAAAFAACEFLVDWLKTKAPFWKLEEGADGAHWVAANSGDDAAAERWGAETRNSGSD